MAYTMKLVDDAISNILGEDIFKALTASNSSGRIAAHRTAIEKAFMHRRNDLNTDILREAMFDLNKGMYKPVDGKFED